uniref:NADH-ubiquinone oxidoreductase chain 6 n=1 Tax=Staphylinidae sp. BMNH 1274640 TaxID=1796581 RepID=A0A140EFW9_9COLE|nr:NADH dehydrogenase subunit 6 [Staphylinidae sp. BMNH 1274640]
MFMLLLSSLISMLFMFMNHPMTMGLTLLIQTILISLITGLLNLNFWFSYILFLIMVGGLLVLFIYMTSIASNELFKYSNKMFISLISLFILLFLISLTFDWFFINYNFFYIETFMINNYNIFLTKYFNLPSIIIIMMMIIYLFITLIAVIKITKIEYGPLRPKF